MKYRQVMRFPHLVLFLALGSVASASTTRYVNGLSGNDNNNCRSSQTACKTIGHVISLAASGDSIVVAPATYHETITIAIGLNIIGSGSNTTIRGATATLQNSIVANSSGENCSGTVTSKGYNLSSDNTRNFNALGDLNNHDPLLGTLGYYGGPTQTIPLLSGSPAIDAGNPSGCNRWPGKSAEDRSARSAASRQGGYRRLRHGGV